MDKKVINGVDVEALFNTIDLIKDNPDIAKFKFRASNQWVGGTHNRATVKDFYGALKEDDSRAPAHFEIDEPPVRRGAKEQRMAQEPGPARLSRRALFHSLGRPPTLHQQA